MTRLMLRGTGLAGILVAFAPIALFAQQTKPTITRVANVASYASGAISPGEMLVLFGMAMGPSDLKGLQLDGQGRVASTLSDVQVLFDGATAPLVYVSERQIAVMAPYGIVGKSTTQVQVVYRGVASDAFPQAVAQSAPGIFVADASGKGQAAMTNSDGTYNSATNPATPGSWVTFYITGEGPTDPPGSDGNVATSTASVQLPVMVRIAGRTAQLLYAGSAPGNVNGFAQINAVIPPDLQYGGNLPLVVQIGDASSQAEVTVAVAGPPAPIPGAPQNLSAVPNSSGQIVLTWTSMDGLATRFHVERRSATDAGFADIANLPSSTTTFTDQNITAGVSYQYRIRGECDWGYSAFSATASGMVPIAQLMPPSNVQAMAASQTQINLTWSNANTNATRFQIERKTGAAGAYSMIATVPSTATSYQDTSVVPNTAYSYRMRSEGATGLSAYSNEASATTPTVPLPPPPVVQAAAISSSQIRLNWSTTATGIVRFRIERRTATTPYAEIGQPGATITSFDDAGLIPATAYLYRMRVETGAGMSPYSNEATATTLQGLPAAPTNLRATATSSTQINLTWTNNAPDATAVRVESRPAGSATFTDIGTAATLTSTGVTGLQPNAAYSFRVRAQNAAGFSGYSSEATVSTLGTPVTVVLVHGINQSGGAMEPLARTLRSILQPRFTVDAGFNWGRCADVPLLASCPTDCTLETAANELRDYLNRNVPQGDIVLVGYSMGGLIARQLLLTTQFNRTRPIAVITLGTPNLGYPYSELLDTLKICTSLGRQMKGDFRANSGKGEFSTYLLNMNDSWANSPNAPAMGRWLAISATSCIRPARFNGSGCPDSNVFSDGVVCDVSARLLFQYRYRPSEDMWSPNFFHSGPGLGLMCDNPPSGSVALPALYNAGANSDVGQRLARFINGL